MKIEGHCYCGAVQFVSEGDPMFQGQCHCRECQYASGGGPNYVMALPEASFKYTKGTPKGFTRTDIENAVTREFCAECGTHITTRVPTMPGVLMTKVGVFDDPSIFKPEMAIFLCDAQPFHPKPEGIPAFEQGPGSPAAS